MELEKSFRRKLLTAATRMQSHLQIQETAQKLMWESQEKALRATIEGTLNLDLDLDLDLGTERCNGGEKDLLAKIKRPVTLTVTPLYRIDNPNIPPNSAT